MFSLSTTACNSGRGSVVAVVVLAVDSLTVTLVVRGANGTVVGVIVAAVVGAPIGGFVVTVGLIGKLVVVAGERI